MARLRCLKCPATASLTLASMLRCSSRSRPSSVAKRRASGDRLPRETSSSFSSWDFCANSPWHRCSRADASADLASAFRASCSKAARSGPSAASREWIAYSRRSSVSKRALVASISERSKRVAPSCVASEFTDRFPFLAIASPTSVTTLQETFNFRDSSKATRRPSAIVSATTTSPRTKLKAFAYISSKETQFRPNRSPRWLCTRFCRRGSRAGTRKSAMGRKVMGGSIRSFR
mmetsp:Transcript_86695/g.207557  ORF Transcript_86695/g.207557 Transcript_86695/m.207557 type:complete len:233 (+) Transcript_86695:1387-2085(+)